MSRDHFGEREMQPAPDTASGARFLRNMCGVEMYGCWTA